MISKKVFYPNQIKIDKKSYKSIDIYYIGYMILKNHLNIYSVNPLYLVFNEIDVTLKKVMEKNT